MKIAVTGAVGLIGWHTSARIHAANCAAQYAGRPKPFELVRIFHEDFDHASRISEKIAGADVVLHFAGVNRGDDAVVEAANPAIAEKLVEQCSLIGVKPKIVYANSIHSALDTPYGRSKRCAGEILADYADRYVDLILPHVFGECARPNYNNVTATIIERVISGDEIYLDPDGSVDLLHAGAAADLAIQLGSGPECGLIAPPGRTFKVVDLYNKIQDFHRLYCANVFPDISDSFDLSLFNAYRTATFPAMYPKELKMNSDERGSLYEVAKGGAAGQSFVSSSRPGQVRGDHFHISLVERFVVVSGEAIIRVRKVLSDEVTEFRVSGDQPVAIDQIPLHTHNIENIGNSPLITYFWANRLFDPADPDTFADPVQCQN